MAAAPGRLRVTRTGRGGARFTTTYKPAQISVSKTIANRIAEKFRDRGRLAIVRKRKIGWVTYMGPVMLMSRRLQRRARKARQRRR